MSHGPGWYQDPSDDASYRYWDGSSWTSQTMPASAPEPKKSSTPWLILGVAVIAVVGVLAVLLFRPGGTPVFGGTPEDTNSARPTVSQWNEQLPSETPSDPDDQGQGAITECPTPYGDDRSEIGPDGRLHSANLSVVPPTGNGWRNINTYMPGVLDHNSMTREIAPGWVSSISVAALNKSDGFTEPKLAAQQMLDCMSSSSLFLGFSHRVNIRDEAFELDGVQGWRATAEVHVTGRPGIPGDVVDVVVFDTGQQGRLSIYITCATIDHQDNQEEIAEAFKTLRIDR